MARLVGLTALIVGVSWLTLAGDAPRAHANPLTGVESIAAGADHTCAVTTAGGVLCWGYNLTGQIGDGTGGEEPPGDWESALRPHPTQVAGLESGVSAVTVGPTHSCALTDAGAVKCWGDNYGGEIGAITSDKCYYIRVIGPASDDGGWPCAKTPVDVAGLSSGVLQVSAGGVGFGFTCALLDTGRVQCWGDNFLGQLGRGHFDTLGGILKEVCALYDDSTEQCVEPLTDVVSIATGGSHACALRASRDIWCWGSNAAGELGAPQGTPCFTDFLGYEYFCRLQPAPVCAVWDEAADQCSTALTTVEVLDAGAAHNCARIADGRVLCWGWNANYELGRQVDTTCDTGHPTVDERVPCSFTPVEPLGLPGSVGAVNAGLSHSCIRVEAGTAQCWGSNFVGRLGGGGPEGGTSGPRDVCESYNSRQNQCDRTLTAVTSVSAGFNHTCAAREGGTAKCWGNNTYGELGNGCVNLFYPESVQARAAVGDVIRVRKAQHGDADIDSVVTSIDAQLVLQYDAALIQVLPCPNQADADDNGDLNAIDASLILQRAAGIIS
jgi:alpha-tubulin suppressor-like RCC1 family protein